MPSPPTLHQRPVRARARVRVRSHVHHVSPSALPLRWMSSRSDIALVSSDSFVCVHGGKGTPHGTAMKHREARPSRQHRSAHPMHPYTGSTTQGSAPQSPQSPPGPRTASRCTRWWPHTGWTVSAPAALLGWDLLARPSVADGVGRQGKQEGPQPSCEKINFPGWGEEEGQKNAKGRKSSPRACWQRGSHSVASWPSNTLELIRALSGRPPRLLRTAGDY